MSESRNQQDPAEQRVFGHAFSLETRTATGEEAEREYVLGREKLIESGGSTWLARTLHSERGIFADLYRDRAIVASLLYDYDDGMATVYTTSEDGAFGDTVLCDRMPFDDAVELAERFAADQP